jgi:hypothetical protein
MSGSVSVWDSRPKLNRNQARVAGGKLRVSAALVGAAILAVSAWQPAAAASPPASTAAISVNVGTAGTSMPAGFVGLAVGANALSGNQFGAPGLATYMKTLDPSGVLRIGGNSSDATFWTSTGEKPPSWSEGTITPASLKGLATLVAASGWKVILGLNFKHYDPARAANEALYAEKTLGSSLQSVAIGNEPNYYYSSTSTYFTNYEAYVAAIRKAVPGIAISGPDPGHEHPAFLAAFASNEAKHPDINEVTDHHYPFSNCDKPAPTLAGLLNTASVANETAAAASLMAASNLLHLPAAITETNSVTCEGTAGVSNVYGAALWALSYGLLLANAGIINADFNTGISGCGFYWPVCTSGKSMAAQPVYYGILALNLVGTGQFVSVTNPDSANIRAYAVENGSHLAVVLDDVQNPASNGPTTVSLTLSTAFLHGQQTVLATSSAAGLSAKTGITLGGHTVAANGTFPTPTTTPVTITGHTAKIIVQAASATIIQFS